jgi:hypothetical protein
MFSAPGEVGVLALLTEAKADASEVWQPAVSQLALRSTTDELAMQSWSELLLSYQPELRLRGLHGLRALAGSQPQAVAHFMEQRFEEAETFQDPVLSNLLVQLLTSLPPQQQDQLFGQLLQQGEEARCAAVSMVWNQALVKGPELLLQWTDDPSARVRSNLALTLCEKMPSSQAFEPLLRLARDAEFEVRTAVAMGMADIDATANPGRRRGLEWNPEYRQLQHMVEQYPSLQSLRDRAMHQAPSTEHPLNNLLHIVHDLDSRPRQTLQELTPWVRLAGSWHRLKTVADFARDPQVAFAARGLTQLCRTGDPIERVLGCLGALNEAHKNPVLQEFALMCRCCLEVLDSNSWQDLRAWSERWRDPKQARSELRWSDFDQLASLLPDLRSPQEAFQALQPLCDTSGLGPLPERELLEPALQHVQAILAEAMPGSARTED